MNDARLINCFFSLRASPQCSESLFYNLKSGGFTLCSPAGFRKMFL